MKTGFRLGTLACLGGLAWALSTGTAWGVVPIVKVVPWVPSDATIPHDTYTGKVITLKGTTDVSGPGFQWFWDFGDGSPSATGTVTDNYVVEARHAYTGAVGTLYTARLTVTDTVNGGSASKPYYVRVAAKELPIEVNVAIDEGLWYLHKTQTRWTSGGIAYGDWAGSKYGGYTYAYYSSMSAEDVCAFEAQGHLENGSPDNPYTETVQRGMHRLFTRLASSSIGFKTIPSGTYNNDQNGNGIGVYPDDGYTLYQGGMIMNAIIASGTPNAVTTTGGASIIGRTYKDIVQDMVDWYLYAQYTGSVGGGWRYNPGDYPDNSVCQWAAIGLIPAEREWGLKVPKWAKDWNLVWLTNSQDKGGGGLYGAFPYYPGYWYPWGPYATTPSGMVQMAMDGIGRGTVVPGGWPNWTAAETFLRDRFGNTGDSTSAIKSYYYGLFSFVKAMLLHDSNGDGIAEPIQMLHSTTPGVVDLDWYAAEVSKGAPTDGVARKLVNDQSMSGAQWGYWFGHNYNSYQYYFETAWAILMLNRTIFDPGVPVAVPKAIPNPGVVGEIITLDGSASFHKALGHHIVSWKWDVDNDGVFDASGPVTQAIFTALGTWPVKLQVMDDSTPQKTAESYVNVFITTPPIAPTADAGGPYVFCPQAKPWFLDGRMSNNPDEGKHEAGPYPGDTIQSYAWDLNGDNAFGDILGSTADVTSFFDALGPGVYVVQLKVTDTTAASFPSSGMGDLSDVASATVVVKAATDPDCSCVDLSFTLSGRHVILTWTDFAPGSGYYGVYRGLTSGGPYIWIATVMDTTYTDDTTVSGTTYYYVVRPLALNGNELCQSNEISAKPICDDPTVKWTMTTKVSNNPRYYRQVFADSDCFDEVGLQIYIGDTMTPSFKAGPFKDEDVLRIAKSVKATWKPGSYGVAAIITVKGQATVWAEDPLGGKGTPIVITTY